MNINLIMDREKYPNYFLSIIVLYALTLLAEIGYFVLPSLSFGFSYTDFYFLLVLIFIPLVLLAIYEKGLLKGKESILRGAITGLIIVNFVIMMYLMLLLI